ncbi:MAG TPA: MarR family transcriptional regulator [Balneolales bacterium]|nr:MarR family transcriptional regulator [Balneolales bacterium]
MSSEEELMKSYNIGIYQKGLINLILTSDFIQTKLDYYLKEYDLTLQQYGILRILWREYPNKCTNSFIKDRMLRRSADTTRLIDRLEKKDLVTRIQSQEDRRQVEITISDKGVELLNQIASSITFSERLLSELKPYEIKVLNKMLEKIRME